MDLPEAARHTAEVDPPAVAISRRMVERLAASLGARCIETHLSWVLLGGHEAWKFKKPLVLPFVDYGTRERRRACCEAELRLNRRYAPSLYLDVSRVVGSVEAPRLVAGVSGPREAPRPPDDGAADAADGPSGPDEAGASPDPEAIEHAVHMRRFDDDALWSRRLEAGRLGPGDIDAFAAWLAAVHAAAPRQPADGPHGSAGARAAAVRAALEGALPWLDAADAARLRAGIESRVEALAPLWRLRQAGGAIRECHGDLHLDNMITVDGVVQAFDGIEFDEALRWIDIVDDLAFPVMDLQARGRRDLAFRLLDGWLAATGEHEAMPALRLAIVYRALVRVMAAGRRGDPADARRHAATALETIAPPPPTLAITHGLPGSGKTTRAAQWLEARGAIRLRSDVERKRLHGLSALDDSKAAGLDLYGEDATRRTYDRLARLGGLLLQAGFPVVLDAAFLRRDERAAMRTLAAQSGSTFVILDCEAPMVELRRRVAARRGDASEADLAVLERLAVVAEPLDASERALAER